MAKVKTYKYPECGKLITSDDKDPLVPSHCGKTGKDVVLQEVRTPKKARK